jgi:hypothetical protein
VTNRENGRILFDRPKPTVGCSASGRRRRRRRNISYHYEILAGSFEHLDKPLIFHKTPGIFWGLCEEFSFYTDGLCPTEMLRRDLQYW